MSSGSSSESSDASSSSDDSSIAIDDQFIAAIQTGDLVIIRETLSQEDEGGRLKDDYYLKALFFATEVGGVGACRLFWGKLSRRTRRRYSKAATIDAIGPLHVAAWNGQLEVVRLLIEEFKWNINQADAIGRTPLCYAARHLETARYLLENGANDNQGGQYGYGPLWNAVSSNNTELTRLLLIEYHANPNLNRRSVYGEDPNPQHGPDVR